jgi:hypothetical protein
MLHMTVYYDDRRVFERSAFPWPEESALSPEAYVQSVIAPSPLST